MGVWNLLVLQYFIEGWWLWKRTEKLGPNLDIKPKIVNEKINPGCPNLPVLKISVFLNFKTLRISKVFFSAQTNLQWSGRHSRNASKAQSKSSAFSSVQFQRVSCVSWKRKPEHGTAYSHVHHRFVPQWKAKISQVIINLSFYLFLFSMWLFFLFTALM